MFGIGGWGPPGRGPGGFFMQGPFRRGMRSWLEGIDLSDEQLEKIVELKQKSFSKMGHARVDKVELMQSMFRELGKEQIDRAKVAELKEKLKAQKLAMMDLMMDNMIAFAEILTPEQRKKIRMKKIRQFLGSEDFEHEHEHPPHPHPHDPHDHRHHHHD